uniref:hypothetical protein n=1 Tax=Candidatus Electronema sp. TaxID=2698783 RepID=UPI00405704EB
MSETQRFSEQQQAFFSLRSAGQCQAFFSLVMRNYAPLFSFLRRKMMPQPPFSSPAQIFWPARPEDAFSRRCQKQEQPQPGQLAGSAELWI